MSRPGRSTDRSAHVRRAVDDGARRWRAQQRASAGAPGPGLGDAPALPPVEELRAGPVLVELPRRPPIAPAPAGGVNPRTLRLAAPFKASAWLTAKRAVVWLGGITRFLIGVLVDRLRRDASPRRSAIRLRRVLTDLGGTFIKLGQQASVRADILPPEYCEELTSLLDRVEPFPVEEAIAAVERVTGAPLADTFAAFDPTPIGSASIACVYQAVLHNGDRVAVKVRRPGIGSLFAADLRVLTWVFGLAERLTLVRPGFTDNVLRELASSLMEELDFYKEARFQEIFGRRAADAPRPFFGAPEVHPSLSGEDVIVEEFVSGVWLFELLAAVESGDRSALDDIAARGIDPEEVARRLIWVSHWGLWDSVFFHGDPHPANIVVQPGNRLVFIDFGAMGSLPASRRAAMREIFNLMEHEDLEGMARLSLTLLEPLPPIDTDEVIKAVEDVFWDALVAARSHHSEWFERTTAQLWLGFFKVTSRFRIPMSYDTLRLIRATLLYDTLAARLANDIDLTQEYQAYRRDAGDAARERVLEAAERRFEHGLDGEDYLRIEQLTDVLQKAVVQVDRLMTLQRFSFGAYLGKLVSVVVMLIGFAFQLTALTAVVVVVVALIGPDGMRSALGQVVAAPAYQVAVGLLALVHLRKVLFRLTDREL